LSSVFDPPAGPLAPAEERPSGPPVDPRFRMRRAEVRRQEGRRRLRSLVALAASLALVAAVVSVLHSPLMRVRTVVVTGSVHTPRLAIIEAAGLQPEDHTLMLDAGTAVAARAVDRLPWVQSVSFVRRWPWTVVVHVRERVPAALVAMSNGAWELVDQSGRALEALGRHEHRPALAVVVGARPAVAGRRVLPGAELSPAGLAELLAAAAVTPPALAARGLQLAVSGSGGLTAFLGTANTQVSLGDASQLRYKMAVLDELASRVDLVGYQLVDLTVPQRPALTPLPNSGNG